MKKVFLGLMVFLLFGFLAGTGNASLMNVDGYDWVMKEDTGLLWYTEIPAFAGLTYAGQQTSIANLVVASTNGGPSLDGWRLATEAEVRYLFDETDWGVNIGNFVHRDAEDFLELAGRTADTTSGTAISAYLQRDKVAGTLTSFFNTDISNEDASVAEFGAWVVRDIPIPSNVPEPTTMVLFGLGLIGVAGVSRRCIA